jgi:hypothetical protein
MFRHFYVIIREFHIGDLLSYINSQSSALNITENYKNVNINSRNLWFYVTYEGADVELPDDDIKMSKRIGVSVT